DSVLKAIQECAESLRNDVDLYQSLARELDDVIKVAAEPFDVLADKFRVQTPPVPTAMPPPMVEIRPRHEQRAVLPVIKPFERPPQDMTLSPESEAILTQLAKVRTDLK